MIDPPTEIEERERLGISYQITEHRADYDRAWLVQNARSAIDYCNRMLADDPNSQQLMYLTRIVNILSGTDDGLPANGVSDAR